MTIYMKIDLHFQGMFMTYLFISYTDGLESRLKDVNFVGMEKKEFMVFLEIFTHEKCENVYYYLLHVEH